MLWSPQARRCLPEVEFYHQSWIKEASLFKSNLKFLPWDQFINNSVQCKAAWKYLCSCGLWAIPTLGCSVSCLLSGWVWDHWDHQPALSAWSPSQGWRATSELQITKPKLHCWQNESLLRSQIRDKRNEHSHKPAEVSWGFSNASPSWLYDNMYMTRRAVDAINFNFHKVFKHWLPQYSCTQVTLWSEWAPRWVKSWKLCRKGFAEKP